VADFAAGWHKNSALPGQQGNVVFSGHHNIKGEVFRYLVNLEPGDVITLYVGDQPYQYAVADKFIIKDKGEPEAVRRENAKWIGPFNDQRLTLVTCWPYNNNTHRLIVIGDPVGDA
jgi:sortase A